MFERVILRNFRSFDELEFNLLDRSGTPKHLAIVFGDNGAGKTNLTSAFGFLEDSLQTMNFRDILQSFLSNAPDASNNESLSRILKTQYKDLETLIHENKMVECDDPMCLEFYFSLNGKKGNYIIETDDHQIIHEHLEYTLGQNKGVYYDITKDTSKINPKICPDKKALLEINVAREKFWGKHSLLSLIIHEINDKAEGFFKNQLADNLNMLIAFLTALSCKRNYNSLVLRKRLSLPHNSIENYYTGIIEKADKEMLDRTEELLNNFFKQINNNIKKVFYKRINRDNMITYKLMLTKMIAGKARTLDFSQESTGTRSLLHLLPYILSAVDHSVVIIDEFDIGLHDILMEGIINSLDACLSGQLIITTHGTQIMQNSNLKEYIYTICEKPGGKKEIYCITHYDKKISINTNIRNQYFSGKYGSSPRTANINFEALLSSLKNT